MKLTSFCSGFVLGSVMLVMAMSGRQRSVDERGHFDESAPAPNVIRITAATLDRLPAKDKLVVGLRDAGAVVVIDPAHGPLDLDRIELIDPNGHRATVRKWVDEHAREQGLEPGELGATEFTMTRSGADARIALGDELDVHSGQGQSERLRYSRNAGHPLAVR